jgi:hypothetical protein
MPDAMSPSRLMNLMRCVSFLKRLGEKLFSELTRTVEHLLFLHRGARKEQVLYGQDAREERACQRRECWFSERGFEQRKRERKEHRRASLYYLTDDHVLAAMPTRTTFRLAVTGAAGACC